MSQRFSIDTIRDPKQLYPLLLQLSNDLDEANKRIANLQIAAAQPPLSLNTILTIRNALQTGGVAPLNVAQLAGILAQSQRGYAVVASSASTLPSPALYEVGTIGAVLSGSTLTFYLVAEGMPRSWVAQTSLAITAIDNSFTIQDDADGTKKIRFEASSISAGQTRVQTVPDTDQILAGRNVNNSFSVSQTIANTLDANLLFLVQNTNATGTAAAPIIRSLANVAAMSHISHGSARVIVRCGITLGGWNELFGSSGSGVLIHSAGATPLVFGTNDVERARIDATGTQITAGTLRFSPAVSQIVPGATSLSLRNNANSADNILITDAGAVTIRALLTALAGLTITAGNLTFGAASGKVIPGATQLSFRNNADSADNLLISNAGDVTIRGDASMDALTATEDSSITGAATALTVNGTNAASGTVVLSVQWSGGTVFEVTGDGDGHLIGNLDVDVNLNVDGAAVIDGNVTFGAQAVVERTGTADPNGAVVGKRGDRYTRTGIDTTNLYIKQTGDGTNTGWVVK